MNNIIATIFFISLPADCPYCKLSVYTTAAT